MGEFGLVGRGIPQFRFLQVVLRGSCICHKQCGQVHTGGALRTLRWMVGVRGGSCPMRTYVRRLVRVAVACGAGVCCARACVRSATCACKLCSEIDGEEEEGSEEEGPAMVKGRNCEYSIQNASQTPKGRTAEKTNRGPWVGQGRGREGQGRPEP